MAKRYTVNEVAAAFAAAGIKPTKVTQADMEWDSFDASVYLDDNFHIQVGIDYLVVVEETDHDSFIFGEIIFDVNEAIKEYKRRS